MKKVFFMLCATLFLVACGGDNPKDIAKNFIESAYNGKVENMMKYLDVPDNQKETAKGKLSMMVLMTAEATNKKGGISNISIIDITENDENANVTLKITFKDKSEANENVRLYKKDKKWYVKM
ncbi:DUF4878 domain-containing protein [Campylobacter sp. MG1]|uniref:DUF4878 domain-containing protein n=1 Tax=Campylobacter sp. MG1 TaxID=2976332 RepID=UPI00226C968C|nr:DUF4878 domain-containing protein [Campylobacter sp. MG1]